MFSKEEALKFTKEKLCVKNVEDRLNNDRHALLDDVVVAMQTELVFQNIRLLSLPLEQRHQPTVEEIKADILSGIGGLCYNMNVAAFFLLQALGYNVKLASATCTSTVLFPGNHVVVYVYDLVTPGDKYIVEVGFGFPTYRAVCLDFEQESPEYTDSFIEYKYIKHEGKVLRMHRKGCPVRARGKKNPEVDFYVDEWRRFYMVEDPVGTTNLASFDKYFHQVFTNPQASPFHGSIRVFGFPQKKARMVVVGKKTRMVVDKKMMIEKENGELEVTELKEEDVVSTVIKLFPVLPKQLVSDALSNFRESSV